jgi:hypothetical protein
MESDDLKLLDAPARSSNAGEASEVRALWRPSRILGALAATGRKAIPPPTNHRSPFTLLPENRRRSDGSVH